MTFEITGISIVLFTTTLVNGIVTFISWQRRKIRSGSYFAYGMMAITLWTLAAGLDYAAVPNSLKVFFATLEAWGYMIALPVFTLFTLSYAGYEHWLAHRWVRVLFWVIPISNILLVTTNGLHGWVWQGLRRVPGNLAIFEHGPAFAWIEFNGYLMILTIILALWKAAHTGSDVARRQGHVLLAAAIFPLAANLTYNFLIGARAGLDWTSITFSVTGILFLRALSGERFMDIVPIARDRLVASLTDGMVVLDIQNRIIEVNQPIANALGKPKDTLIGRDLTEIIPMARSFLARPLEQEIRDEYEIDLQDKRVFDVILTPVRDGSQNIVGRILIARDVTEWKVARLRVEQQLQEIQQLHKELQETQAQLVEQERLLARQDERRRLGRNLHDSVNQSVHSLMLFSETLCALLEKEDTEKSMYIAGRIQDAGRQALKEIRLLVYESHTMPLDQHSDLISVLEERFNMVERRVGIVAAIMQKDLDRYPSEWNENLYWMITEALNNSLKHSQARHVTVLLQCSKDQLEMEVSDDGVGFDQSRVKKSGFGMRTLCERAEIIGGLVEIESSPGHGTRVCFHAKTGA